MDSNLTGMDEGAAAASIITRAHAAKGETGGCIMAAADNSIARETIDGLKTILSRLAEFFDIFDLSFIVSGVTAASALTFWGWRADIRKPDITGVPMILGGLILCYVLGIVCFATGRWIRTSLRGSRLRKRLDNKLYDCALVHGQSADPLFKKYIEEKQFMPLYTRLWATIRHTPELSQSFFLLKRYWVMAATCDGCAAALTIWALVLIICSLGGCRQPINPTVSLPGAAVIIAGAVACWREAARYVEYQIEEITAAISEWREKQITKTSRPSPS